MKKKKKSEVLQTASEKLCNRPGALGVAQAIGWVTFLEIVRDRVLYNIVLCSILLFGMGFLASRLTFIRPERVILDFGLSALLLSCAMIAVFTGASLLGKEFERRTVYVALCHPITRAQFILGKFVGLVAVLTLNWFLLSGVYLMMLGLTTEGMRMVSPTLFLAIFLVLVQSAIIASIAIFCSSFSTTSLAVILTIGFYLMGNTISQIRLLAVRLHSSIGCFLLNGVATLLPNLEYFNLGTKVSYGLPVTWQFVTLSVLYGTLVIALLLYIAGFLVQRREV